jgi:hypothetical protein
VGESTEIVGVGVEVVSGAIGLEDSTGAVGAETVFWLIVMGESMSIEGVGKTV